MFEYIASGTIHTSYSIKIKVARFGIILSSTPIFGVIVYNPEAFFYRLITREKVA
jgi:hypothetical protein